MDTESENGNDSDSHYDSVKKTMDGLQAVLIILSMRVGTVTHGS